MGYIFTLEISASDIDNCDCAIYDGHVDWHTSFDTSTMSKRGEHRFPGVGIFSCSLLYDKLHRFASAFKKTFQNQMSSCVSLASCRSSLSLTLTICIKAQQILFLCAEFHQMTVNHKEEEARMQEKCRTTEVRIVS